MKSIYRYRRLISKVNIHSIQVCHECIWKSHDIISELWANHCMFCTIFYENVHHTSPSPIQWHASNILKIVTRGATFTSFNRWFVPPYCTPTRFKWLRSGIFPIPKKLIFEFIIVSVFIYSYCIEITEIIL